LKFVPKGSDRNPDHNMKQKRKEYRPQEFLSFASRSH
jgi:hypothetical protein